MFRLLNEPRMIEIRISRISAHHVLVFDTFIKTFSWKSLTENQVKGHIYLDKFVTGSIYVMKSTTVPTGTIVECLQCNIVPRTSGRLVLRARGPHYSGFAGLLPVTFFRCFSGIDLWTTIIPENVTQKVPHEPQGPPKVLKIHPRGTQNQTFCE